jgi:mannose-1-phosphate guanylyltransferase
MAEQLRDAIIIAGGFGTRMRHLTADRPKPMVELAGRPIVEWQIDQLKAGGIECIVFATGHMADKIRDHFGDGGRVGVEIRYSHENTPLGRGGAIKQAMGLLPETWQDVAVTNADNIWDTDINEVYKKHKAKDATATLVLVPVANQFGVVETNEQDEIVAFREKPVFNVNAGIYVFSRDIYPLLPDQGDHEKTTFPAIPRNKLIAYHHAGFWKNIDNPLDLEIAEGKVVDVFLAPKRAE